MLPLVNTVRECTVTGSSCCDCTGRRRSSFPSRAVRLTTPRDDVKTDSSSNRPLLLPCPGSCDYSFVVTKVQLWTHIFALACRADPFQRPDLAPQLWDVPTCSNGECVCVSPRSCLDPRLTHINMGEGVTALSGAFCRPFVDYPTCVVVERAADTVRHHNHIHIHML